jgi:hypothetical protein
MPSPIKRIALFAFPSGSAATVAALSEATKAAAAQSATARCMGFPVIEYPLLIRVQPGGWLESDATIVSRLASS